jgi:hypothetical protein
MTTPVDARPCDAEQDLETRFRRQTDRLIELTSRYRYHNDDALAAEIVAARLSLADTAAALRRLAEGRPGAAGGSRPARYPPV